jgi:hypothetical protein
VFAYRLGEFVVLGPEPVPRDELMLVLAAVAAKRLKRWRN